MKRALRIDVKVGETIEVSGPCTLTLVDKSGKLAALRFSAEEDVKITPVENRADLRKMIETYGVGQVRSKQ